MLLQVCPEMLKIPQSRFFFFPKCVYSHKESESKYRISHCENETKDLKDKFNKLNSNMRSGSTNYGLIDTWKKIICIK